MSVFLPNPAGSLGSVNTSASSSGGGEAVSQVVSFVASTIVQIAFASSIKKDQKRFEQEIAKLDEKKQLELLQKVQQVQTELERQNIVFQYIDKARIEELKNKDNNKKYIYIGLAVGIVLYGLMLLKFKKK
jgi:formiminotetrahydrofolate cyclodeaminase